MNILNSKKFDYTLTITETDIVNGGDILVLVAYVTKTDNNLYNFPEPQIFNKDIYMRNKEAYDKEVSIFRKGFTDEETEEGESRLTRVEETTRMLNDVDDMTMMAVDDVFILLEDALNRINELEIALELNQNEGESGCQIAN